MNDPERIQIAATWWAERLEIVDKREAFRAALVAVLEARPLPNSLGVDYDPDGFLWEALTRSGIDCSGSLFSARGILPAKTRMWFDNGGISVREGYRATTKELVK